MQRVVEVVFRRTSLMYKLVYTMNHLYGTISQMRDEEYRRSVVVPVMHEFVRLVDAVIPDLARQTPSIGAIVPLVEIQLRYWRKHFRTDVSQQTM